MGQQQLFILLIVTIIIGTASIVAIDTFGTASESSNVDMVRQDLAAIAAQGQRYFIDSERLGGGGNDFEGLAFAKLNFTADSISSDGLKAINLNGLYVIDEPAAGADSFVLTGHPVSRVVGTINFNSTASRELEVTVFKGKMAYSLGKNE